MAWIIMDRAGLIGFIDYQMERMVPGSPVEAILMPVPGFFDLAAFEKTFDHYSTLTGGQSMLYGMVNYRSFGQPCSICVMERTAHDAIRALQTAGMKRVDHMLLAMECATGDDIDVKRFAESAGLPLVATRGRDFVVEYVEMGVRGALKFISAEAHYESPVIPSDRMASYDDLSLRLKLLREEMLDRGGFDTCLSKDFPDRTVSEVIDHPHFQGVLAATRVGNAVTIERTGKVVTIHA